MELTHIDREGQVHMVDVGAKKDTQRTAIASGQIYMKKETLDLIRNHKMKKGDPLVIAQIAGIMGAKQTSHLIPLCHPIPLTSCDVTLTQGDESIYVEACAKTIGKTGIEMEALTAVSIALLTIYDMCKAVDKDMRIADICLIEKSGGRSGHYVRKGSGLTKSEKRP